MGVPKFFCRGTAWQVCTTCAVLCLLTGCQASQTVSLRGLVFRQSVLDFSGLQDARTFEAVKVSCAVPQRWHSQPLQKTSLYAHQQWRSPSLHTGVGVVYVRLPLPLSAKALIWLSQREFAKRREGGKLLAQWTDDLGRPWFEGENSKYHVRGYVMTNGFEAWIVYCGYKIARSPDVQEISLATRCVQSVIPTRARAGAQTPTALAH